MGEKRRPSFIRGEIQRRVFDGISDDLLTAGMGASGFQGPPPSIDLPTPENLRRLAIYFNAKGLLDTTPGGGYGTLFGPGVGPDRGKTENEGKIPGKEYLAFADDGTGTRNVTLMVQIPESFDPDNSCIVASATSGSRGIYGAVSVVGEWALKRGFAVAYTDKGTGNAIHDLDADRVSRIDGEVAPAAEAGKEAIFIAEPDEVEPDEEKEKRPSGRIAFKHAHSKMNPEARWGENLLQAIRFAFYVLNLEENLGVREPDPKVAERITRENTTVIAAGISNGGGAALRAAEADTQGLIDGVAVSEPNVNPAPHPDIAIRQGEQEWRAPNAGRSLFDYTTLLHLYQPCANLAPENRPFAPLSPEDEKLCENRCQKLAELGLLRGESIAELAQDAQRIINDYAILKEQNRLQPIHWNMQVSDGIAVTYANAYGRLGVADRVCGYSFSAVDAETGAPAPFPLELAQRLFAEGNGIPPTGGVEIINEHSHQGPLRNRASLSAEGSMDGNLNGALCLRRLATGTDESGNPLTREAIQHHQRISTGIGEIRATGDLHGLPALIVNGRNDAILAPNHTSRAYVWLNRQVEGENSRLRYYEITNAHHLDALNGLPGFNAAYVPLHPYLLRALDLLWDHLKNRTPLPESQVVETVPRGIGADGKVFDIALENIPPIESAPAPSQRIAFEKKVMIIPEQGF